MDSHMRGNGSHDHFSNLFHEIAQASCTTRQYCRRKGKTRHACMKLGLKGKGRYSMGLQYDTPFGSWGLCDYYCYWEYVCLGISHGLKYGDCKSMLVNSRTLQVSSRHSRKLSRPSQLEMWGMQQWYEYQPQFPAT